MRYKKGKRGSIINKHGVKITKKEQNEIAKLVKEVNKVREEINKSLSQAEIDKLYENLGMENPMNVMRRSKNLHQFVNRGLLEAWKKQAKEIIKNPKKYLDKKKKQFQKNYINAMLNNFKLRDDEKLVEFIDRLSPRVKELLNEVLNDSPDEFYDKYLSGYYPEMNENYIPQEEYEKSLGEVYSIYEDEDIDDNELIDLYNRKFDD